MKRWFLLLPVAVLLAAYVYVGSDPVVTDAVTAAEGIAPRHADEAGFQQVADQWDLPQSKVFVSDPIHAPDLPASLQGTQMDGAIELDGMGRLVRSISLRRLFDYWLTTLGEQDLNSIRTQIASLAESAGGAVLAAEVVALFDDYVAYLQAAESIVPSSMQHDDLIAAHEALFDLRRQFLGHWADAFFGVEEAAMVEQITQMQIRQDPDLDPETRRYLLEQWEDTLPDPVREARFAATAHHDVMDHSRTMRREGVTEAQMWQEWERAYGAEAADRLAAMEASRTDFAQVRDAFVDEYRALTANPDLTVGQRAAAVEALLSGYDDPMRRRLLALARLPEDAMDPDP